MIENVFTIIKKIICFFRCFIINSIDWFKNNLMYAISFPILMIVSNYVIFKNSTAYCNILQEIMLAGFTVSIIVKNMCSECCHNKKTVSSSATELFSAMSCLAFCIVYVFLYLQSNSIEKRIFWMIFKISVVCIILLIIMGFWINNRTIADEKRAEEQRVVMCKKMFGTYMNKVFNENFDIDNSKPFCELSEMDYSDKIRKFNIEQGWENE